MAPADPRRPHPDGGPFVYLDIETLPAAADDPLLAEHLAAIGAPDPALAQEAALRAADERAREEVAKSGKVDGRRKSSERMYAEAESARADAEAARAEAIAKTALMPTLGRVCCAGYAIDGGPVVVLDGTEYGAAFGSLDAEAEILHELARVVASAHPDSRWVGHRLRLFDAPFLRWRTIIRRADRALLDSFGALACKPWDVPIDDTAEMLATTDPEAKAKGTTTLDRLCAVLGIPRQGPGAIMGADVYSAYLRGDFAGIREHQRHDIRQVRAVHRRLVGLPDIAEDYATAERAA